MNMNKNLLKKEKDLNIKIIMKKKKIKKKK